MPGNMVLNPDFKEFFQLLNANEVHYLIIGGYAVAFHGYPRYTKDIDIWIWIDQENAQRVVKTLQDFGFESLGLKIEDFLEGGTIIQLGYAPNRIDLIMGAPGVVFEECYPLGEGRAPGLPGCREKGRRSSSHCQCTGNC